MSICDKINTAGNTLQSKLNARGVSCTYGKNSDNKQTITDMANLITNDNLKGANDSIIHLYANRPYLMSGERTDLILALHDGLGNPLANKEVTISADIEDEVINNIFKSSNWSANIVNQNGVFNDGSTYRYMTSEFTASENYSLTFYLDISYALNLQFRFGDTTSGSASNYLLFKINSTTVTVSKVVNGVETTLESQTISSGNLNNFLNQAFTISRSGDTYNFFGISVTLSGLKNTIGLYGEMGIYSDDFDVTSLYAGITKYDGLMNVPNISVTDNSIFTASYQGVTSSSVTLESCIFADYGIINNSNLSNYTTKSSNINATVTDNYTELTTTSSSAVYLGVSIPNNCKICFDIYQTGGSGSNYFFRIDNDAWGGYFGGDGLSFINGGLNKWIPVEITFQNKEIYTKNLIDGTVHQDQQTAPQSINNPIFRFWEINTKTLRFRNFRVIEL